MDGQGHPEHSGRDASSGTCLQKGRRRFPGPPLRLSEVPEPTAPRMPPDCEAEEVGALVGRAVKRLPPFLRAVVSDKFFEDLSLKEIATRRGCSATYAGCLFKRALADLRWMLPEMRC